MATRAFQRPESVPLWIEVKNTAGTLVDPTSASLVIYDPDGEVILDGLLAGRDMASSGVTGYWVYYFESDTIDVGVIGWFRVVVNVLDGVGADERTTVVNGGFTLA